MCLCSPAPEMALAHSHLNRWELPKVRALRDVSRFELSEMSTDGSCRTRFELSEMCLCSPAPEMALAHSHLNRWELPN